MSGQRSSIELALDSALTAFLAAVSTTLSGRVAWANRKFDPNSGASGGTEWFRSYLLPGQPQQLTLGGTYGGNNLHVGVYQVDCLYPKGEGKTRALAMADAISSYLRRGVTISRVGAGSLIVTTTGEYLLTQEGNFLATAQEIKVRILMSWVGPDDDEGSRWFKVPVSVSWQAAINNT